MGFSESTKLTVKRKADFTCCWCRDRLKKVDVHHIVSEADGGPDDEDNAAPLCESCHGLFGDNPRLKKEIKLRRDQWYEICSKVMNPGWGWPIGLDVPLLEFVREIAPTSSIPASGIQFTDKNPTDASNPPLLYLSIYFKRNRYFGQYLPPGKEKWLYLEANLRFAFNLRLQVRALNDRDIIELMGFLTGSRDKYLPEFLRPADHDFLEQFLRERDKGWSLHGPPPENSEHGSADYFNVWRENGENRLMLSTFTSTHAGISIHARFSQDVALAFAGYLEKVGFTESLSE